MSQISWLTWVSVGAVSGWLASMVMKTNGQYGLIFDIIVGVLGVFIGSFVFNLFGSAGVTGFNMWSVFVTFSGAVILLAVIHLFIGQQKFSR